MNVVALRSFPAEDRRGIAPDHRIARVAIYDDMAAAEPHWRELQRGDCLSTPYQRFAFLKLWQDHVGTATQIEPFIVVGLNAAGEPLFLWPLGRRRLGGARVIEFLGGKHTNFNMGLWRRDVAAKIGAEATRAAVARLAEHADVLALVNQPPTWRGTTNPFAMLPQQRAVDFGFSGALAPDFDALLRSRTNADMRKKMRKKESRLAKMGEVRFERVAGTDNIRRVLDAFFKQKSTRMRLIGSTDAFAAPGVRRFIEAAATGPCPNEEPAVELYALTVNDIVVATLGGIVSGGRFCAMFNSILPGRYAVESPGEQLIVHLVRSCCERGLDTFDVGIGKSRFKKLFCADAEPLFDSYLPLSAAGQLLAGGYRSVAAAKRTIKQTPALWSLVHKVRRLRARYWRQPQRWTN
jgi:CelD/BcsL family acetyltransferase involved in cellulose biosynthesis